MTASLLQDWLDANDMAVEEAAKYLTKKGAFNPPLEKNWPEWERLRKIADDKWYAYRKSIFTEGVAYSTKSGETNETEQNTNA